MLASGFARLSITPSETRQTVQTARQEKRSTAGPTGVADDAHAARGAADEGDSTARPIASLTNRPLADRVTVRFV